MPPRLTLETGWGFLGVSQTIKMKPEPNWSPVVASLLKILQTDGFDIKLANYEPIEGTTPRQRRQFAKAEVIKETVTSLILTKDSQEFWILLVILDLPEFLVTDWTEDRELKVALKEFSDKWKGRVCPTR